MAADAVTIVAGWEIPLREVSALTARKDSAGAVEVLAAGDERWAVAAMAVGLDGAAPKATRKLAGALAAGGVRTKGGSEFEGVAADGAGRVFVLQEGPSRVLVLDPELKRLEGTIALTVAPSHPDIGAAWAARPNARGEGLVLLRGGHLLVAKQRVPAYLVEFGPAGDAPLGCAPASALAEDEAFAVTAGALEVLATWSLDVESINDLAVGPDGRLHFVSSLARCIGRLDGDLVPGQAAVAATTTALPAELFAAPGDRVEGLVFVDALGWLVALDIQRRAPNLHQIALHLGTTLDEDAASPSLNTDSNAVEHCAVDPASLAALDAGVGRQVLVTLASGSPALYTATEQPDGALAAVRVGTGGLARFGIGTTAPSDATIAARFTGGDGALRLTEELRGSATHGLAILAPHGGSIEEGTDEQAVHVYDALAGMAKPVRTWIARGFRQGGGAHRCWHITSSEISEGSFPGLGELFAAGATFAHAIAFHGHGGSDVVVGGGLAAGNAELKAT